MRTDAEVSVTPEVAGELDRILDGDRELVVRAAQPRLDRLAPAS